MIPQHVAVGGGLLLLSVLGLVNEQRFLDKSRFGQRLIQWFGPNNGPWAFRGIISAISIFGVLLAAKVIRPVQW